MIERKFSIGDIIVCTDNSVGAVAPEVGEIYRIVSYWDDSSTEDLIVIEGPGLEGVPNSDFSAFYSYRFRLANYEELARFIESDQPNDIYRETPEIAELRARYNGTSR